MAQAPIDQDEYYRQVAKKALACKNRSKYRAVATTYNGVRYASKAEAARAQELDLLVKAGEILCWIGQPKFRLGVPENVYVADFLVVGRMRNPLLGIGVWVEDVKGRETPKFRRDKKLWARYGRLELRVIRRGKQVETIPGGADS